MSSRRMTITTVALMLATLIPSAMCDGGQTKIPLMSRAVQLQESDLEAALAKELASFAGRGKALEDQLREMFNVLPKNAHGNLGHQSVRYALHRFFLQKHGWFIRGLEPHGAEFTRDDDAFVVKEWVPSFLQGMLEKLKGDLGADLRDTAVLAAALEDLVRKETEERLKVVYRLHELQATDKLSLVDAKDALSSFYMFFLVDSNFTAANNATELRAKRARFAEKYAGYKEAQEWFNDIFADSAARAAPPSDGFSFDVTSKVASAIGERYSELNERECKALRSTLRGLESRRAGRVRLSTFYNSSKYSHWAFIEKPEYLRRLGVLDESDPKAPAVIIPNYAMARHNCLDATNLYAICCRNECEGLLNHVEQEIGGSFAEPSRIAELVAMLPSESVQAPRQLPSSLLGRLDEVAAHHGGKVPLHGRLFAQWMHHAYPLECPAPREPGTANPQTEEEWVSETQASDDEMREHVESDVCAINAESKVECSGESIELPWSMSEELLTTDLEPDHARGRWAGQVLLGCVLGAARLVLLLGSLLVLCCAAPWALAGEGKHWKVILQGGLASKSRMALCALSATALMYCLGLLDLTVFLFGTVLGLTMLAQTFAASPRRGSKAAAHAQAKRCCDNV